MRWIRLVGFVAVFACAGVARAESPARVILLTGADWPATLTESLQVELTARSLDLEEVPVFSGQGMAAAELIKSGAAAAVIWLEPTRDGGSAIRVLGSRSTGARKATLPGPLADLPPRVFALIAASLADETLDPPAIDVHFELEVNPEPEKGTGTITEPGEKGTGTITEPEPEPELEPEPEPGFAPPSMDHWRVPGLRRSAARPPSRDRWFVEGGGVSAPMVGGVQLGVGRWVTGKTRVHLQGMMVYVVPAEEAATYLGLALSRVGKRRGAHVGANVGYVSMPDVDGFAVGAWIGWRWPLGKRAALDARVGIQAGKIDDEPPMPVPLGTLTIELPL